MNEHAIILRHPSAPLPVLHDPREQEVREDAVDALALHLQFKPTDEEHAVMNGLCNLMEKYGADRVMSLIRYLAAIHGEEV